MKENLKKNSLNIIGDGNRKEKYSHSSVERNIGPDANITIDFALVRLTNILDNMIVYPKKMLENLNLTKGLNFLTRTYA